VSLRSTTHSRASTCASLPMARCVVFVLVVGKGAETDTRGGGSKRLEKLIKRENPFRLDLESRTL